MVPPGDVTIEIAVYFCGKLLVVSPNPACLFMCPRRTFEEFSWRPRGGAGIPKGKQMHISFTVQFNQHLQMLVFFLLSKTFLFKVDIKGYWFYYNFASLAWLCKTQPISSGLWWFRAVHRN